MIQVIYLYIEVNLRKKLLITKCFLGGGSIQFSFAYIPDRINHLIVSRINFDICNIRYYELYVYVISYFKETVSKNQIVYAEGDTLLVFKVFKVVLVYFQRTFHCFIKEAAYHTNFVPLIICLINNTL